ncbi:MAG: choice-of-anchor E domain-containing protein [Chitinophagaceae bacterium]
MKYFYSRFFIISFIIATSLFIIPAKVSAQCPVGYVPDGVAFDTTINFSSGRVSAVLKFPKFDPTQGMVTCAKLTMEMTGTLNALWLENYDASGKTANAYFTRHDTITGDNLPSPLLHDEADTYGPYSLGSYDGVPNSGPDYVSVPPGQIFTASTSFLITNLSDLASFYGPAGDSLTYNYNVDSRTTVDISGNWLGGVITTGSITYRLEYCYCPPQVVPINVYNFRASRISDEKAQLTWDAASDPLVYYYEVEYSKDGSSFTKADIVEKQTGGSASLTYNYQFTKNDFNEKYYFRIKQHFSNGKSLLTDVKSVDFTEINPAEFSLHPNPSSGIIGIKFDKSTTGVFLVSITNAQGQILYFKKIEISDNNYRLVTSLQNGVYWISVTDAVGKKSFVNQLLIK